MRRVIGEHPRQQARGTGSRERWDRTAPPVAVAGIGRRQGGSALKPEGCQGSTRDGGRPDEVVVAAWRVAGGKGWKLA